MCAVYAGTRPRSLVVTGGDPRTSEMRARALVHALEQAGHDITYIGGEPSAKRIAVRAADVDADSLEVCLPGAGGARFLRALLRELDAVGRKNTHIVVHRVT